MPYNAGTAHLQVVPSFRGIQKAIQAEMRKAGVEAGKTFQENFDEQVNDKRKQPEPGPGKAPAERRGKESGGAFADAFKQRVTAALKSLPPAQIGVATNEAEQKLKDLRAELTALSGKKLGIDIGASDALLELQRIKEQLDQLGAETADVGVKVDSALASAELSKLQAQVSKLAASEPTVEVDVDAGAAVAQLAAVSAASHSAGSGISGLVAAGALLAPVLVPAAAAAAAAIAGIGAAAVAGVAGIGVLALGFSGVGDAVKAMGDAHRDAGKQAQKSAQRAATSQLQVVSAVDQIRSAEAGVANARANAADAAVRSARQIREAQEGVAEAARGVRDAERDVAEAQARARDVQRSLTEARQEARRALEDMATRTKELALDQRAATLAVEEAKRDLDRVLMDPKANEFQRQQAKVTYDQAVQRVEQLSIQQKRLAEDKKKADKAGVEGSEQVRAAQERIKSANEGVRDAQERLVRSQERLGDAHEKVAEAVRAQSVQQRQSAFAVAQAQQSLVSAQRALTRATQDTGVQGSASMDKLREAMDALSPAGRSFAAFLYGLKPAFKQVKAAAEGGLLPGVEAGLRAMMPLLPSFTAFVGNLAKTMGDLFKQAGLALNSPFWRSFFDYLSRTAGPNLVMMSQVLGNLARAFAGLLMAFEPLQSDMGQGLVRLTARFAAWSESLKTNQGFQNFVGYVRQVGPKLLAMLGSVVGAIGHIAVALAPLADPVIAVLKLIADGIRKIPTKILTVVVGTVVALGVAFWGVTAAVAAVTAVMAINPFVLVGIAIVGLVAALVLAYKNFEGFRRVVDTAWRAIVAVSKWAWENVLRPAFKGLSDVVMHLVVPAVTWLWKNVLVPAFKAIAAVVSWAWQNVIKPAFTALSWWVNNVLGPVFTWLYQHVVKPVWQRIQVAISIAWAVIKVIFGVIQIAVKVLGAIFTWLWRNSVKPVWDAISGAISWNWRNIIKPTLDALGGFLQKYVVPVFKAGVTAIGRAWDAIVGLAKAPVRFVVNTVLNDGLLAAYNRVAKIFHVKPDDVRIRLPQGFARGGINDVVPGYTPGRDVHTFFSPTGGAIALSGGEPILRPEAGAVLGHDWVYGINSAARRGGTRGVTRFLGGFADGGVFGKLTERFRAGLSTLRGVAAGAVGRITDPLLGLVTQMLGQMPGAGGEFAKVLGGAAGQLLNGLKSWIGGKDSAAAPRLSGGAFATSRGGWPPRNADGSMAGNTLAAQAFVRSRWSGLSVGTYVSPHLWSYHHWGKALDIMMPSLGAKIGYQIADWFVNNPGKFGTAEVIYAGRYNGGKGWVPYTPPPGNGLHYDHVHLSLFDQGGMLPPGLSLVANGTGRPERVLNEAQWSAMSNAARGGGVFQGELYLQDGTFMGKVRGEMAAVVDAAHGQIADALIYSTGR